MRSEYDFSKSRKNPYASQLKRQVTIRLDTAAVNYFKEMAAELGMPYQNLINLFLRDCAMQKWRQLADESGLPALTLVCPWHCADTKTLPAAVGAVYWPHGA